MSSKNAPETKIAYDREFQPSEAYANALPDTQNLRAEEILGSAVAIQEVGSSNFRLPLCFPQAGGGTCTLETGVQGTVRLQADRKGINMSRIIRVFYEYRDRVIDFGVLREILENYLARLDSTEARLRLSFSYPVLQDSLRSGLAGYQYYDCVLEGRLDAEGRYQRMLQLDFVYSSACPCSSDLSEHARHHRQIYSIPHSQRSRARVRVVPREDRSVNVEDLIDLCRKALVTETQTMVRRLDEQAFAELNGSYQKFVEDAVRLLYRELDAHKGIEAFSAACSHLESLHSHDAVALVSKGLPTGLSGGMEDYNDLIC